MGRFSLQSDQEEEECSEIDSYDDDSYHRWNDENDYPSQSRLHRSHSYSVASSLPVVGRAVRRFQRAPLEDGEIPEDIDVIPEEEQDYPLRQLTRYEPQQQQQQHQMFHSHSAPIHYHIHYTPPPQPQSNTPWKWIAMVAILSHFIYVYGTLSPVWMESGLSSVLGLLATCSLMIDQVGSFDWQGMRFWTNDSKPRVSKSVALLHIPNCFSTIDSWPLFGQDMAFERLQTALRDYSIFESPSPLILYATGGPGVGKRHMARLLAQSCSSSFLEADLATVEMEALTSIIRDHVVSNPHGSVLLLSHLSQDPSIHVNAIIRTLDSFQNDLSDLWQNVIVVFTSLSGAPTIDKAIRHYGKDSLPTTELVWYLRQSLPEQLQSAFVLPFVPLDQPAVQAIVQHELHVKMEVSSLNYLLDHALEWQTWIHKQTQTEIYTFLPNGGHDASLLIHQLMPPETCGEFDKDSTWLEVHEDRLRLVSCIKPELKCQMICQYPLA